MAQIGLSGVSRGEISGNIGSLAAIGENSCGWRLAIGVAYLSSGSRRNVTSEAGNIIAKEKHPAAESLRGGVSGWRKASSANAAGVSAWRQRESGWLIMRENSACGSGVIGWRKYRRHGVMAVAALMAGEMAKWRHRRWPPANGGIGESQLASAALVMAAANLAWRLAEAGISNAKNEISWRISINIARQSSAM